jgi:hypothetical protein
LTQYLDGCIDGRLVRQTRDATDKQLQGLTPRGMSGGMDARWTYLFG